jgi:hypothetical protein
MADSSDRDNNAIPTPQEFCLTVPLYKKFAFGEEFRQVVTLEQFNGTLDCYCLECHRDSVFNSVVEVRPPISPNSQIVPRPKSNHIFQLLFQCSRNKTHKIFFIFRAHLGTLEKIGQFPSIADLATPELKKYRKVLGNERHSELTRGIGLASHGVGIGAFVYLRRIFESLIEEARVSAAEQSSWDQTLYEQGRMVEKIAMLASFLPTFLVENRMLYSIMSTGIHSLSEADCLSHFDTVRLGIELILDEHIQKSVEEQKIQQAKSSIAVLGSALRSGKT